METFLQREKVRVYALARELNVDSKDLLEICKQAGFDVKNQLSSLDPDQRDLVEKLVKRGTQVQAQPAKPGTPPVLPEVQKSVPVLPTGRPRREAEVRTPPAPAKPAEPEAPQPPPEPTRKPLETPDIAAEAPKEISEEEKSLPPSPGTIPAPPSTPVQAETPSKLPEFKPVGKPPPIPSLGGGSPSSPAARAPDHKTRKPRELRPVPHLAAPMPPIKQRSLKDVVKKTAEPVAQKPIARLTPEQLVQAKPLRPEDVVKPALPQDVGMFEDEDEEGKGKKLKGVPGRDRRQKARNERAEQRKRRQESQVVEIVHGKAQLLEKDDRPLHARKAPKVKIKQATLPRIRKPSVETPITVRSLSEALGVRSVELLFKLRDRGATDPSINSTVEESLAEELALEFGAELEIKKTLDTEGQILAQLDQPDQPEDLIPRAPVVTIMGHVDHGKTTLLDKIRQTNIAATEAGGITQVIRAWRVLHHGHPITFLDTPGHEAFTKMRARGANVTDIAVIVVAADDGVMPQTEEAIQHARAAGVQLVVAINKVDLPGANINKTRQQLYSMNILPDNMGGDTPFVETSAQTGKGLDELLEQIAVVAELKELKANPNKPGRGTCLEAMLSEGEGVRATLLIREGTLRRGDVILCGVSYGRVRQMYDDLGRPITEAGPSVPVRITGLDFVPNAGDLFNAIPDLAGARTIAENRRAKALETAMVKRIPFALEKLTEFKVAELKIILKADFRGSIEAIRKELDKFQHEEVRISVLRADIGGISENDVWLALASPEDTLIIGFNVVPDEKARSLAEERNVQIRLYDIIYNLANDMRAALEGKLKPREEVVQLGRAIVREVFKISRVGTVAGCYITQGTIKRAAKVRLIRDGVVIYPPPDRTVGLESLKRFKEDTGEVREGFECGMKVAGYDDIKVGDVIEAFRIDQVQRTL